MPRWIAFLLPVAVCIQPVIGWSAVRSGVVTWRIVPAMDLGSAWQLFGFIAATFLFCLALGLAFILFGNSLLLFNHPVPDRFSYPQPEDRGNIYSLRAIPHTLYNLLLHVASMYYLPIIKSSYFIVWFYRAMGAKIGKGTIIATNRIWDADLIEIGENCIIGGNSSIAAHYAAGARGRLGKVRIGNSVTIGANTTVMPGLVIEDNVTVGANSLVALGMHLKSGGTYLGVPVERIK